MRTFEVTVLLDVDDADERTEDDVRGLVWGAITRLSGDELHGAIVSIPKVEELHL